MPKIDAGSINVDIDSKTAGLKKGGKDVKETTDKMGRNFTTARRSVEKFGTSIRNLGRRLTGLRAIGALLGGGIFAGQVRELSKFGAGLAELHIRTGATVTELERVRIALEADGLALQHTQRLITTWASRLDEAASEGGEYARMLERIGVNARMVQMMPLTDQFITMNDALADFEKRGGSALGIIAQLFGVRQAAGLTALYAPGRFVENLQSTSNIPTLTTEQAQKIKAVEQAFTDLGNSIRNHLLLSIYDMDDGLKKLSGSLQKYLPAIFSAVVGQGKELAIRGGIGVGLIAAAGTAKAAINFGRAIQGLATAIKVGGGVATASGILAKAGLILLGVGILIEQIYKLGNRALTETELAPLRNFYTFGATVEEQREGLRAAILEKEAEYNEAKRLYEFGKERRAQDITEGNLGTLNRWPTQLEVSNLALQLETLVGTLMSLERENAIERGGKKGIPDIKAILEAAKGGWDPRTGMTLLRQSADDVVGKWLGGDFLRGWGDNDLVDAFAGTRQSPRLKEIDLHALGLPRTVEFIEKELTEAQKRINEFALDAAYAFENLVFSLSSDLSKLGDAFRSFVNDIARSVFRQVVTEPLGETLGRLIGRRASGGYASGLTLVGEAGPELVDFRSPAMVYSSQKLAGALAARQAGGPTINISFAPEVVAIDSEGVQGALRQSERDLEQIIRSVILEQQQQPGPVRSFGGRRM